jgi:hypothetical protein
MNPPNKINDGGPAFPTNFKLVNNLDGSKSLTGESVMTLRDWLAGLSISSVTAEQAGLSESIIATRCYAIADAMITEREMAPE